jgi:hypothetical protein
MLNHFSQIQEPLGISQKLGFILFLEIENFINIYPILIWIYKYEVLSQV